MIIDALGLDEAEVVVRRRRRSPARSIGGDMGLFIGRHGQTIDAVQHLAQRIVFRGRRRAARIVIDAAGYRERRATALRGEADEAADEALRYGRAVALDAMVASERKLVHEHLRERGRRRDATARATSPSGTSSSRRATAERAGAVRRAAFHVFPDGETMRAIDALDLTDSTAASSACSSARAISAATAAAAGHAADAHPPRGAVPVADARFPRTKLYGPYHHGGRSYYQWMARGRALVRTSCRSSRRGWSPSSTRTPRGGCGR